MPKGILGRKSGMTQIFDETGHAVPVTVIEAGPCVVVHKRTAERDGYTALQLGFGQQKERRVNKPKKGHFQAAGGKPVRYLREARGREGEGLARLEVSAESKVGGSSPGQCGGG